MSSIDRLATWILLRSYRFVSYVLVKRWRRRARRLSLQRLAVSSVEFYSVEMARRHWWWWQHVRRARRQTLNVIETSSMFDVILTHCSRSRPLFDYTSSAKINTKTIIEQKKKENELKYYLRTSLSVQTWHSISNGTFSVAIAGPRDTVTGTDLPCCSKFQPKPFNSFGKDTDRQTDGRTNSKLRLIPQLQLGENNKTDKLTPLRSWLIFMRGRARTIAMSGVSVRLSVTRWYWVKLITVRSCGFHHRVAHGL